MCVCVCVCVYIYYGIVPCDDASTILYFIHPHEDRVTEVLFANTSNRQYKQLMVE